MFPCVQTSTWPPVYTKLASAFDRLVAGFRTDSFTSVVSRVNALLVAYSACMEVHGTLPHELRAYVFSAGTLKTGANATASEVGVHEPVY